MIFFGKRILPAEAVDKVCPVQKDDRLIVFFALFIIVHTFPSVIFLVAVIIARVRGIVKQKSRAVMHGSCYIKLSYNLLRNIYRFLSVLCVEVCAYLFGVLGC